MSEHLTMAPQGIIQIIDTDTKEIVLEETNDIHFENFSVAIAKALANDPEGHIHEMHFGNGGATINGVGALNYFPPNIVGLDAELYNPTYFKVIDDNSPLNADTSSNKIEIRHIAGTAYTDILMTCTLERNEPNGQNAFDTAENSEGDYIFDEIGLKAYNTVAGTGELLTHAIFSPVEKAANRSYTVLYTIRIKMV